MRGHELLDRVSSGELTAQTWVRGYGHKHWRQLASLTKYYPSLESRFKAGAERRKKEGKRQRDADFRPAHDTKVVVVEVAPKR